MEEDLATYAAEIRRTLGRPLEILVIGCGLFQEHGRLPADSRCTLLDVDPRVQAHLPASPLIAQSVILSTDQLPSALSQKFDLAYAKEVIEHIEEPAPYLESLLTCLRPGGGVWLSTPNYGEPWLPLIESTLLEVIARSSGSTRRGMHVSRFSRRSLARALTAARFKEIQVQPVSFRLGLVAHARA